MNGGIHAGQGFVRQKRSSEPSLPKNMRMLLVDDEPEICLLLQAILVRQGMTSTGAHSLAEARQSLKLGNYDGVFLDVNLPDGKGYELIPELKANYPHTRVIVISAMDQERTSAMNAGADLFLPKPLHLRTILGSLKEVGLVN
jgi:two-component system OmpR family response regulator